MREKLEEMPHQPVLYAVRATIGPCCRINLIELGGLNLMEHGHLVPNLMTLAFRAKDHGADLALFGHTHEPLCEYAYGVMLLNPGSAGNRCRGGAARASLLLLDKDKIRVEDVL